MDVGRTQRTNGAGRTDAEERDRRTSDQVALIIETPAGKTFTIVVDGDTAVWAIESAARSLAGVHNRHQVWPMGDQVPLADPERPFGDGTAISERLAVGEMHMANLRPAGEPVTGHGAPA